MGLKERRKKIMALMLAACVAGTSVVPVAASEDVYKRQVIRTVLQGLFATVVT